MAKVVTIMILSVDLKCSSCYKKVKKLLSKFPEIRDQVFDEDKNKVMITVVSSNPVNLRDKLCYKGGNSIQSIEILEKPSPKPQPEKPKQQPPTHVPVPVFAPKPEKPKPKLDPEIKKPDPPVRPEPVMLMPEPMHGYPFGPPVPVGCRGCYDGRDGGPYYYDYGRTVPPPPGPCYQCNYGYEYRPGFVTHSDYCREENQQGCSVM